MTNSGFLHATCLHDNTFDTLDSVVSRLEATFLSSVRSPSNCTSPTRCAIVFFRGVYLVRRGERGCFQTESIQSGGNGESLAENVSSIFELHGGTSNCSRDVYESALFHCVYTLHTMCTLHVCMNFFSNPTLKKLDIFVE